MMKIDGNEKEKAALREFDRNNREEAHRLQDEFVKEFREAYEHEDHCPCKSSCKYHGKCRECVAIHRAHQSHVPNCMRDMLNERIKALSALTEHTVVESLNE